MFEFLKGRIRRNRCLVSIITVFCLLLSLMAIPKPSVAAKNNFLAGSLIIPMDTTYQDMGMWKAYGLVYELLNQGILVSWAIEPNKTFNQSDFTAMTEDLRTGRSAGIRWGFKNPLMSANTINCVGFPSLSSSFATATLSRL